MVTDQPRGAVLSKAISSFFTLKDAHAPLFILNFLSAPKIEIIIKTELINRI